jgi:peptidoglycan/LPS O-acetylase OafA/YrhL
VRLAQLDTVRMIAIGLVIIEHYGGGAINSRFPLGAGSLGVGLFFCLSGFLITSILLSEFSKGESSKVVLINFYARRFLRLMPPYYAWIAILVLLGIEPVASSWLWHVAYLSNVWNALGNPMLDFWSLAVEEQFYLIWPFIILLAPTRHRIATIVASTLLLSVLFKFGMAQIGYSGNTIQTLLFTNLSELGVGAVVGAMSFRNGGAFDLTWYTPKIDRIFMAICCVAIAISVLAWYLWGTGSAYRYYINDFACALPMAWVVIRAAIGFTGTIGRLFDNGVAQYIGRISYGIYLTHNFVPHILRAYFGDMPRPVLGVASIVVTFIITSLSWHYFEQPVLKLKRYFTPAGRQNATPRTDKERVKVVEAHMDVDLSARKLG